MNAPNLRFAGIECAPISVITGIGKTDTDPGPTEVSHGADLVIIAGDGWKGVVASLSRDTSFFCARVIVVAIHGIPDADPSLAELGIRAGVSIITRSEGRRIQAADLFGTVRRRTGVSVFARKGESSYSPSAQRSLSVQRRPSSHARSLFAKKHPTIESHRSSVQRESSSQTLGVPVQTPSTQVSLVVQASPSSHSPEVRSSNVHSPLKSQEPVSHGLSEMHSFSVPWQTPLKQMSFSVHGAKSLQAIPSSAIARLHFPSTQRGNSHSRIFRDCSRAIVIGRAGYGFNRDIADSAGLTGSLLCPRGFSALALCSHTPCSWSFCLFTTGTQEQSAEQEDDSVHSHDEPSLLNLEDPGQH